MLERPVEVVGEAEKSFARHQRLRATPQIRSLVAETRLSAAQLVQPLFVQEGLETPSAIPSMPGVHRLGLAHLADEAQALRDLGVGAAIVFGIPEHKDSAGSGASGDDGIAQQAMRALKEAAPDLLILGDVCLCEYTSHGHCGVLQGDRINHGPTLQALARTAVTQAEAGADVVAPSAKMDGQVAAIRAALDEAGHHRTPILSYSVKYASGFYGPFREAAASAPSFGDRRAYQMDVANSREAMRAIEADLAQGADMVLIKPALPSLDILHAARQRFDVPLGAYQVSGEYAMVKAAAANGWLDEARVVEESLTSIQRAGADFTVTYFAKDVARRLDGARP